MHGLSHRAGRHSFPKRIMTDTPTPAAGAHPPAHDAAKAWSGRFTEPVSELVKRYTASVLFDQRMAAQDIRGSLAHAKMLARQGIIAASDVIAMSALRALAEHGVKVPGQVHVVGYDDLPFANQTVPTLSTVKQDLAAGAGHLVDLLFRRIAGEATRSVVLKPELVIRQSS